MNNLNILVVVNTAVFVAALISDHYHLVFFGDDELYNLYLEDSAKARARLETVWQYGNAWLGFAEWSGIHYITKYVLKDDDSNYNPAFPSFTISSKNLGTSYLNSPEGIECLKKCQWLQYNKDFVYSHCPRWSPDNYQSVLNAIEYFRPYVPVFKVALDSGKIVPLPRIFRRKLIGSFEHFKDSPLWLPNLLMSLKRMHEYLLLYGDYDVASIESHALNEYNLACARIHQRLIQISHDKLVKKYATV